MSAENEALSFATGVDTSGYDEALTHMEEATDNLTKVVEEKSAEIGDLLNDIPQVNLDILADTSSMDKIDAAFEEIDRIVDLNKQGIAELQAEFERLGQQASEAFNLGTQAGDDEYRALKRQQQAVEQVINARKKVVSAAGEQADALRRVEVQLKENSNATKQNEEKQVSLKAKLKELKMSLVEMEMAGQRNTQAYRDIQQEAARLTDALGDAQAQANILANDQAGFQGVLSGLSGLSGGFAAAQGAVALFGGENEELQQIMLKVQSLMAITMGLQQLSVTLNKDSAFSLVTLNGLKRIWNKLMGEGATAQAAETAATEEHTAATIANAEATGVETEAEILNTEAEIANSEAEAANAAAKGANATATTGSTAANASHTTGVVAQTGATVASTVATKAATLAMKGLKIALVSTGIGALIVLLGELVGWLMKVFSSTSEAAEKAKEMNEVNREGRKIYAETKVTLEQYQSKLKNFNGTKEEEQKLVKELNDKYGEQLGYYDSVEEWEAALIKKGPAYMSMLQAKAEAQALLNKYTEAYIELQELANDPDLGKSFWRTKAQEQRASQAALDAQTAKMNSWLDQYKAKMGDVEQLQSQYSLGGHADPKARRIQGGGSNSNAPKPFDAKKAAEAYESAYEEYTEALKQVIKDANDKITAANIQYMADGLDKMLRESDRGFQQLIDEWKENFLELARVRKDAEKAKYMQTEGHTEQSWAATADGKKSDEDWLAVIFAENVKLATNYEAHLTRLRSEAERARWKITQDYNAQMVELYGSTQQKIEQLEIKRIQLYNSIPPQFIDEAERQLDAQIAKLESEKFKAQISWDIVFGDMSQQSLDVLEYNLDRVKKYFEANKDSMGIEEVKEYQDAIRKLQDAIAERNPFGALHQSLQDIGKYKAEFVAACQEYATASSELTAAQQAYNEALAAEHELAEQTDDEGNVIREQQEGYAEAVNATALALQRMNTAEVNSQKAEQRVLNARNNITVSYKRFAQSLTSVNSLVQGLGGKAQNLAAIFSADVAKAIGKALDFTNEIMDAMSTVMSSIGDLGKSVATGVEEAVEATSQGATASAAAGAAAMSTLEKASAILAIIGAAMQVATAIANLFNNDDEKQEEIERLQKRIDQLQWELDNPQTLRLQENAGKAIDNLNRIYGEVYSQFAKLAGVTERSSMWEQWYFRAAYSADIYSGTVKKLADYYAQVSYTADKALGSDKWKDSRDQLDKYAEQIVLIKQQIGEEESKKKSDSGKIAEYQTKIEEIGQKMQDLLNGILEEIIGYTAEDLASTLGEAFIEAAAQGEDAMKAWGDKTKEIVADILKRMLIAKMIEEPIGQIFDKYKKRWFGTDGQFKGIDAITSSMDEFANDINGVGETFEAFWNTLPDSVKDWFGGDDEREGASRGIATASQESVDENNARLTTIQGHTYTLVQGMAELNRTSNAILDRVTGIERNTTEANEKLDEVKSSVKVIRDTVDNIHTQGIRLKT